MANVQNFGDSGKVQHSIKEAETRLEKLRIKSSKIDEWMGKGGVSPAVTRKTETAPKPGKRNFCIKKNYIID